MTITDMASRNSALGCTALVALWVAAMCVAHAPAAWAQSEAQANSAADHWSGLGTGLDGAVEALAVDGNGRLYAGGSFAHAGVTLCDAAPNPFNPQTTLRFDLRDATSVRLAIYDLRGRLVRSLVDEELSPGAHESTWDGRDDKGAQVASGTYLARIDAGAQQATICLTLIK